MFRGIVSITTSVVELDELTIIEFLSMSANIKIESLKRYVRLVNICECEIIKSIQWKYLGCSHAYFTLLVSNYLSSKLYEGLHSVSHRCCHTVVAVINDIPKSLCYSLLSLNIYRDWNRHKVITIEDDSYKVEYTSKMSMRVKIVVHINADTCFTHQFEKTFWRA